MRVLLDNEEALLKAEAANEEDEGFVVGVFMNKMNKIF